MTAKDPTAGRHLLILGLGYSGRAVARAAMRHGLPVTGTSREPGPAEDRVPVIAFDDAGPAIAAATHLLVTAAPGADGDPVLARHGAAIAAAGRLSWIGYLSTTGVYGDRGGGWVDEESEPRPGSDRSRRRLAAEEAWRAAAGGHPLDIFRLAGIYGPGRSALDELRAGRARRIDKPGHLFGRIHRDDIAGAVIAALEGNHPGGARVLNLSDDEPAEPRRVTEEAARLLGLDPPPLVPFDQAWAGMSPMARSFWAEDRKVRNERSRDALGLRWRHPSYRDGLRAILVEERGQLAPQQDQVARP